QILTSNSVDTMVTSQATRYEIIDGISREYGYGMSMQPFLNDTLFGHGGMMGTTTAYIGWLDQADIGVVVACNTAPDHHPTVAGHAILSIIQGHDPKEKVPRLALEKKAKRLVGEYETYQQIRTATVQQEGTTLSIDVEGRVADQSFKAFPEQSNTDNLRYYTVSGDKRVPVEFVETEKGLDMLLQRWRFHRRHE
ncbi:MAG: penicillin-binding protein, partial [Halobacteriaceae archaeon]